MRPALETPSLRPHGLLPGSFDEGGPRVIRIDPADGAEGVFGDAPVVITLSHAADATTLGPRSVRVCAGDEIDGRLALSPDGRVVIWTAQQPLQAREHVVEVSGLRDRRGRDVRPHRSTFTVAYESLSALMEDPA
ncbi:MAG TPA: Ig-like domain-containing protein, partial [Vicinamibacteria bacterium]|nr:Ig-like domain-containing protein [Vicinamibacteria bacterium]